MAHASDSATRTSGNTRSTASYSCDSSGFGYSIITDDIKADFDFLTGDLTNKLDESFQHIDNAANITDAFYFEGSSTVSDLSKARDELKIDYDNLKTGLSTLHSAFMTDIDNINAELAYNFGWIIIGEVKGSTRNETIETDTNTN